MPAERTNQQWIQVLSSQGSQQAEAIGDLRNLLLRAALFTLVKNLQDLRDLDERERLALAEDCTQDALQAVLAHLMEFRGDSKFTTWAYKFGINIALTRARKERWKHISLDALSEEDDPLEWVPWKDSAQSADSEMPSLQSEVRSVIEEVVRDELTGRQRQVLKWIAFDEVPMDVVVERLGSNRNAIYKLLHDARLKIKQHLAARGYEVAEIYDLFRVG
jgi:RNA polymerase sigma-70 factor (ECF subfamily)